MTAKTTQPVKPGYKSTQFYTTSGGAAALLETARQMENPWVQGAAIVLAGLALIVYTWSRTRAYGGAA